MIGSLLLRGADCWKLTDVSLPDSDRKELPTTSTLHWRFMLQVDPIFFQSIESTFWCKHCEDSGDLSWCSQAWVRAQTNWNSRVQTQIGSFRRGWDHLHLKYQTDKPCQLGTSLQWFAIFIISICICLHLVSWMILSSLSSTPSNCLEYAILSVRPRPSVRHRNDGPLLF